MLVCLVCITNTKDNIVFSTSVLVLPQEQKEVADRDVLDRALTSKDGTLVVQCGETKDGCCASDLILWATEHPDSFIR